MSESLGIVMYSVAPPQFKTPDLDMQGVVPARESEEGASPLYPLAHVHGQRNRLVSLGVSCLRDPCSYVGTWMKNASAGR